MHQTRVIYHQNVCAKSSKSTGRSSEPMSTSQCQVSNCAQLALMTANSWNQHSIPCPVREIFRRNKECSHNALGNKKKSSLIHSHWLVKTERCSERHRAPWVSMLATGTTLWITHPTYQILSVPQVSLQYTQTSSALSNPSKLDFKLFILNHKGIPMLKTFDCKCIA